VVKKRGQANIGGRRTVKDEGRTSSVDCPGFLSPERGRRETFEKQASGVVKKQERGQPRSSLGRPRTSRWRRNGGFPQRKRNEVKKLEKKIPLFAGVRAGNSYVSTAKYFLRGQG